MTTRKNQKNMTAAEWKAFIDAVNKIHGTAAAPPAYRTFVKNHVDAMSMVGMSWGVHSMAGMSGRNFLSWHRWFVLQMEKRLQKVNPKVFVPYWDAITDRAVPAQLKDPALLASWGVTRGTFATSQLATPADLVAVNGIVTFNTFQRTLEGAIHAGVHIAVGGDMAGSSSPSDPLFWLHHANIDRIWAKWQETHTSGPSNKTETLKPTSMFGIKVSAVQSIATLGYNYV